MNKNPAAAAVWERAAQTPPDTATVLMSSIPANTVQVRDVLFNLGMVLEIVTYPGIIVFKCSGLFKPAEIEVEPTDSIMVHKIATKADGSPA